MAEQTTSSILIDAAPAEIMAVIADFDVLPALGQGRADRRRRLDVRRGAGRRPRRAGLLRPRRLPDQGRVHAAPTTGTATAQVTWTLVEGKMLRALDGAYVLAPRGDGTTEVTYRLALDVSIPLIGMLKRKGEKILIDTALKGLKKRVESLG